MEEKILKMETEISHLEKAIKDIAPKLNAALVSYHTIRNKHGALVTSHRELQRDLKLLRGDYKKLAPYQSAKKSLNKTKPKMTLAQLLAQLSPEDKAKMRAQLLED